jgi:threonylcarbamoyladenosine tRNA methylthiotransferase MtaB
MYNDDGTRLDGLIAKILAGTSRVALRLSSLEPDYIGGAFTQILTDGRVRPHFHLSIQSGSDKVLRDMRRHYSAAQVRAAIESLRKIKDDPFLACDVITGFPGETDADFEDTYRLCKDAGFAWIHAFPFSRRPGTEAWDMKNRVPERIAGERVERLTELARAGRAAYIERWLGREAAATVERDGRALSDNYLHLLLKYDACSGAQPVKPGQSVRCRILRPGAAKDVDAEAAVITE